ncbi:hypothetical protein SCLCIDRAFT_17343 [Scleroderma citrinum Foug A]|uniref:DUF6589 domain-containing protein n=1 Tax=Scleroderma citrinum Foug A TaxID=1036808 RepID=A0A0C3D4Q9_9AGAM|nr:hypothetical protein SCLCIDRAFT_17343 [Scleroderma citrinum Foug A]
MARDMEANAPGLWQMLSILLDDGSGSMNDGIDVEGEGRIQNDDSDTSYWDEVDAIDLEGFIDGLISEESQPSSPHKKRAKRRMATMMIVSASFVLGIFFQSTHTPQKVINTLARIGISISTETINAAVRSLSIESANKLRTLGQSLLAAYAYNNFDVDLKSHVLTVEKTNDSLKHLTSGILFPLVHGMTSDDLKCAEELWRLAPTNPMPFGALPSKKTWRDLLSIHPDTFHVHCTKRVWCVTTAKNLDAPDISQHVVLVHGDLGTGERLQAVQLWHSIEDTPWDQFRHVLFIPGLFHLKMACAEAIWRCFIQPPTAQEDETSLIHDISILCPRETGLFCTKPGFRWTHQLIGYAGTCWRLNCWRIHVKKRGFESLEAFAASRPTLDTVKTMANELVQTYVARYQLRYVKQQPAKERDELSYAMNKGDIGRVETCIVHWVPILKALGKHKYAMQMTNFLINVHFIYPARLRCAVRYHWLVNPTGQPMKWRAVDWCVELNNLFTKVKNGGKGSNWTVERILLESPLVQAYRNAQAMIQKCFLHTHLSTRHTDPNMTKTFKGLMARFELYSPHDIQVDLMDKGQELMAKAARGEVDGESGLEQGTGAGDDTVIGMDDVLVELL